MPEHNRVELLAPARDREVAFAAIDCGADAIYMGGPRFGARQAAGNSVDDIAAVVEYARRFGVRVYVTLNTVVFENELENARRIAQSVIDAGADALIVQDMAYVEMGLSGVELHASTQTFNATPEKAAFLANRGFSRVILERSISLDEIKAIRAVTDVELECFVHGAICVCRSGRCYMSRTMSSRSGNRGDCSQACRLTYDLLDADGHVLRRGKHLLSVKDLDLSGHIGDLLDAGVSSFKIEGRLKDAAYVKNTVAWYRRRIDRALALRPHLVRASSGHSDIGFEPDISKTFSRGWTEYYFGGRRAGVSTPDTPKATGSMVGRVVRSGDGWFETDGHIQLAAGDGLCFMYGGELSGTNVNKIDGARIYTNRNIKLSVGMEVYRNYDHRFSTLLDGCRTRRAVDVVATVKYNAGSLEVTFTDADGVAVTVSAECGNGEARDTVKALDTISSQLQRSGDTMFDVVEVCFDGDASHVPFVRISELNALRRKGLDKLLQKRQNRTPVRHWAVVNEAVKYPCGAVAEASENVTNSLARKFYMRTGCKTVYDGYDMRGDLCGVAVMTTPFCVRRENGLCCKGAKGGSTPLWLKHGPFRYRLEFDCGKCEMRVIFEGRD